jgi:hypothetical protein
VLCVDDKSLPIILVADAAGVWLSAHKNINLPGGSIYFKLYLAYDLWLHQRLLQICYKKELGLLQLFFYSYFTHRSVRTSYRRCATSGPGVARWSIQFPIVK